MVIIVLFANELLFSPTRDKEKAKCYPLFKKNQ